MSGKIEVRYSIVGGGALTYVNGIPTNAFHKYIVYTDSTGKEWYARGGPYTDVTIHPYSSYALTVLETECGEHKDGSLEWDGNEPQPDPRETILIGDDLSAYWDAIKDRMDEINDAQYLYNFTWQNSNSTIDDVLDHAGLPAAHNPYNLPSPGSNVPLQYFVPDELPTFTLPSWLLPAKGMFDRAPTLSSPLILDLDGDGIETTKMGHWYQCIKCLF